MFIIICFSKIYSLKLEKNIFNDDLIGIQLSEIINKEFDSNSKDITNRNINSFKENTNNLKERRIISKSKNKLKYNNNNSSEIIEEEIYNKNLNKENNNINELNILMNDKNLKRKKEIINLLPFIFYNNVKEKIIVISIIMILLFIFLYFIYQTRTYHWY